MKIDRKLNFVFPVDTANGVIWIHSMPLGRETFETYYHVLGQVFTSCFEGEDPKHIALAAPQLALPALKAMAKEKRIWDTPGGVQAGLINELIRLTNVVFIGGSGWETLPLAICITRGIVDEDQEAEILSALVFFTSISRVAPRALASTFLDLAGSLRKWRFVSLPLSEFRASLPISTPDETTPTPPSLVIA
jgi:hypothetical protein